MYRAASGALVFGAGTADFSFGLDTLVQYWPGGTPAPQDPRLQQMMVNLLADMAHPTRQHPERPRPRDGLDRHDTSVVDDHRTA